MTYEYKVGKSAQWRCVHCGGHMIALMYEDDTGRFVQEVEPLLCPRCSSVRTFFSALTELGERARSAAEFMNLLAQLLREVAESD